MFKSFTTSKTKPTSYREEIVARKRLYRPYVTDGLKVYYDFANRASQQSGIARAFNLAGDDATAIHYNVPVYTPNGNLTYMSYDGVDDYSQFIYDNSNVVDSVTIEMITKINTFGGDMLTGTNNYDIYMPPAGMGFNTGRGESRGVLASYLNSNYDAQTKFNHYVFVFKNDPYESLMYINGELQTLAFINGSAHAAAIDLTSTMRKTWGISSYYTGAYPANTDIAEFKLYDRELSAREVAYNYGVAKSRKGV